MSSEVSFHIYFFVCYIYGRICGVLIHRPSENGGHIGFWWPCWTSPVWYRGLNDIYNSHSLPYQDSYHNIFSFPVYVWQNMWWADILNTRKWRPYWILTAILDFGSHIVPSIPSSHTYIKLTIVLYCHVKFCSGYISFCGVFMTEYVVCLYIDTIKWRPSWILAGMLDLFSRVPRFKWQLQ